MATITITPGTAAKDGDSWMDESGGQTSVNHHTNVLIRIGRVANNQKARGLMILDLSAIPLGSTIISSKMVVNIITSVGSPVNLVVNRLLQEDTFITTSTWLVYRDPSSWVAGGAEAEEFDHTLTGSIDLNPSSLAVGLRTLWDGTEANVQLQRAVDLLSGLWYSWWKVVGATKYIEFDSGEGTTPPVLSVTYTPPPRRRPFFGVGP